MSRCADPLKVSWSQIALHESCKQKARLIREHKKSVIDDIRNFFHGTVCDRVMRAWLTDPRPGAMPGMVEEFVELCLTQAKETGDGVVRWRSRTDRSELTVFCQDLVTRLEPYLEQWVLPYEYAPEYRFSVPIHIPYLDGELIEIELRGGIDILVRLGNDPSQWRAFDLKATKDPNYVRKVRGQGVFYDIAIIASFGVAPVDFVFLQPMVEGRPYEIIDVSAADRRSMMARIIEYAHDCWRGDDTPKPDAAGCSWCPVRGACRKFSATSAPLFTPVRARSTG